MATTAPACYRNIRRRIAPSSASFFKVLTETVTITHLISAFFVASISWTYLIMEHYLESEG